METIRKWFAAMTDVAPMGLFVTQLRRIRRVADWLDDQKATRDVRKLQEKYAPLIAEAERQKNLEERDRLLSEWSIESDLVLHPIYGRKSERLTAKARKYGITVPPQPASYSEDSEDWYLSNAYGFWFPSRKLEQRLQREIRDEQRASNDELRKWATLAFAIVGSILAFVSIRTQQKQPDPCPRGYYRNDSGDCVFALSGRREKNASTIQGTPILGPVAKPSPSHKSAVAHLQ